MLSHDVCETSPHCADVDRFLQVPGVARQKRGGDRTKVEKVPVFLAFCVTSRVEVWGCLLGGKDPDIRREKSVPPADDCTQGPSPGVGEIDHLFPGMYPRIGTACRPEADRLLEEPGKGILRHRLDGDAVRLKLKPLVLRPVVTDRQLDTAHYTFPADRKTNRITPPRRERVRDTARIATPKAIPAGLSTPCRESRYI